MVVVYGGDGQVVPVVVVGLYCLVEIGNAVAAQGGVGLQAEPSGNLYAGCEFDAQAVASTYIGGQVLANVALEFCTNWLW